jgi:hypothetical protein
MFLRIRSLAPVAAALLVALTLAAQTPAPADGLSGAWHFVLIAQDGPHEIDASLKVEAGQVTGKWGPSDVKGTFREGVVALSFPFNYAEGGLEGGMVLKGKLADGKLSGTWEFAGFDGAFTADRPK